MTHQAPLFCESLTDAIRDVVRACGGTKVIGCKLWPEKTPDAAARLLADCLNDSRPERLTPDHLMLLARMGRERGCHSIMAYLASELGYAPPSPVEPADEVAELQRQYIESTRTLIKMAERIERLRSVA